jgi:hypothetical protein
MQFRPRVMRDGECAQGPVGIAPVTRRHVLGHGGVPAIAAGAAAIRALRLALRKDLDGAWRQ